MESLQSDTVNPPSNLFPLTGQCLIAGMSSESDLLSALEGGKPSSPPNRRAGLLVAGVAGGIGLAVSLAAIPFLTPALRKVCIPYVPATPNQLANVVRALGRTGLTTKELGPLIDLGSGDGRVVRYSVLQERVGDDERLTD